MMISMLWKTSRIFFHGVENPMITRNCPVCHVALEPEDYEGIRVLRCPQCAGHLVELNRYEAIQRLPAKTLADLEAEARDGFRGDSSETLRCPRCRGAMRKQPLHVPGFDLHMDLCKGCALAWLDGGELAMAQLGHQSTPGFRDRQELKRRHEAMEIDPERQAAFKAAVAKLPREHDSLSQGLRESVVDALGRILFQSVFRFPFR